MMNREDVREQFVEAFEGADYPVNSAGTRSIGLLTG